MLEITKLQLIGFTRSVAKGLEEMNENITINAVCPGLMDTPLIARPFIDTAPQSVVTSVATVVRAITRVMDDDTINGQAIECSADEVQSRPVLPWLNKAATYVLDGGYREVIDAEDILKKGMEIGQQYDSMVARRQDTVRQAFDEKTGNTG